MDLKDLKDPILPTTIPRKFVFDGVGGGVARNYVPAQGCRGCVGIARGGGVARKYLFSTGLSEYLHGIRFLRRIVGGYNCSSESLATCNRNYLLIKIPKDKKGVPDRAHCLVNMRRKMFVYKTVFDLKKCFQTQQTQTFKHTTNRNNARRTCIEKRALKTRIENSH